MSGWCNITVSSILISAPPFLFPTDRISLFHNFPSHFPKPLSVVFLDFRLVRSSISQVAWKHPTFLDSRWDPSQGSIAAYHHNQSPCPFPPSPPPKKALFSRRYSGYRHLPSSSSTTSSPSQICQHTQCAQWCMPRNTPDSAVPSPGIRG